MWQNNFFLAWVDWSHAFNFRMFWKNINCFQFWWKTYTKHCKSNCVISCVKRLSSPSLCSRPDAFNFRVWLGKQNMAMKIPILILLYFCLLCWLFFLIGIHSIQGWTATMRHGVTRKEAQKRLQDTENLLRF